MKLIQSLVVFCVMVHHLSGDVPLPVFTKSFIIKQPENKKKYSTNELKENIGNTTESLFDHTTHVTEYLGKIQVACAQHGKAIAQESASIHSALGRAQQTVACMQRNCSSVIKKIVDDQAPFKKAKKPMLTKALEVLTSVRDDLAYVAEQFKNWCNRMQGGLIQSATLKTAADSCEKKIVAAHAIMQQDECLKHV